MNVEMINQKALVELQKAENLTKLTFPGGGSDDSDGSDSSSGSDSSGSGSSGSGSSGSGSSGNTDWWYSADDGRVVPTGTPFVYDYLPGMDPNL